jgi:hypothetical protein
MMKKIIVLLLALSSVLTLIFFTGCANGKQPPAEDSENADLAPENVIVYPECSEITMKKFQAIYQETGCNPVIESTYDAEAKVYTNVKINAYYAEGFGKYLIISEDEYKAIQEYQNKTGIQVIYPNVNVTDRPTREKNKYNANIYYQVENPDADTVRPKLDSDGNFIPNYWAYAVGSEKTYIIAGYNSLRIEGEDGVSIDGENYYYVYGRLLVEGVEVRVFRYAYYEFLKATAPEG